MPGNTAWKSQGTNTPMKNTAKLVRAWWVTGPHDHFYSLNRHSQTKCTPTFSARKCPTIGRYWKNQVIPQGYQGVLPVLYILAYHPHYSRFTTASWPTGYPVSQWKIKWGGPSEMALYFLDSWRKEVLYVMHFSVSLTWKNPAYSAPSLATPCSQMRWSSIML